MNQLGESLPNFIFAVVNLDPIVLEKRWADGESWPYDFVEKVNRGEDLRWVGSRWPLTHALSDVLTNLSSFPANLSLQIQFNLKLHFRRKSNMFTLLKRCEYILYMHESLPCIQSYLLQFYLKPVVQIGVSISDKLEILSPINKIINSLKHY